MPDPQNPQPLDFGSLRSAIEALGNALDVIASPEFSTVDIRWRDTLISGVVQHFEFTFELCWKMLKRQLERELPSSAELDGMSFRQMLRLGHEQGLVAEVEPWFEFRELLNIIAHTYAKDKALKVSSAAPALLAQARALLQCLDARHDA